MQEIHDFLAHLKNICELIFFLSIKFKVIKKQKDKNADFVPSEFTKSAFQKIQSGFQYLDNCGSSYSLVKNKSFSKTAANLYFL